MRHATLLLVALLGAGASAQTKTVSARQEIARLEKELADQRALLLRMAQLQTECAQQMVRLAQGQPLAEPTPVAAPVTPAPAVSAVPTRTARAESSRTDLEPPEASAPAPAPAPRKPKGAEVTGQVHVTTGGAAWVFVEDVKGSPTGGPLEIRQEDKQFSPRLAAVTRGTKVTFPNYDVLYHNVFSLTPGSAFDLGMLRAGDPVKSRVMDSPGVVQIFCNLHSRMSASVLVTPGPLLTRVGTDGSFRLEGVPPGTHRISAWAGGPEVTTKTVEVGPSGADVQFQIEPTEPTAHKNKLGQPYGSYGD